MLSKTAFHPFHGPEKISRRGSCLGKPVAEGLKAIAKGLRRVVRQGKRPQGNAHGRGHTDSWGAAYGQIPDGRQHLFETGAGQIALFSRQGLLIPKKNSIIPPGYCSKTR
jgi:hypothetical protein